MGREAAMAGAPVVAPAKTVLAVSLPRAFCKSALVSVTAPVRVLKLLTPATGGTAQVPAAERNLTAAVSPDPGPGTAPVVPPAPGTPRPSVSSSATSAD